MGDDEIFQYFKAANDGNLMELMYWIEEEGIKVNIQDDKGRTSLHFACSKGKSECTHK